MSTTIRVRVHYPAAGGRIVLRTDADWEADLAPRAVDADGARFEFALELDGSHRYFKPVLLRDGGAHWAQGENALALAAGAEQLDLYPFFFSDTRCSECERTPLPSRTSSRQHSFRVFSPPGYDENPLARFPVVYMHDGQNLFFPDEAFNGQHWRIAETLRLLDSMNLIRRAIVVGVYPEEREVDYTAPGYDAYGSYLVEELKPWIDEHYRTLRDPGHTAVMGSSLGGVASLHLGWRWPRVFGLVGCLSSTFGYRDDLLERVRDEAKRDLRIYLDSGWPHDNYEVTRAMRNVLLQRGYREGRDLMYLAFPGARHDEQAWATRAHIPFQFFFGERPALPDDDTRRPAAASNRGGARGSVAGRSRRGREADGPAWLPPAPARPAAWRAR